MNCKLGKNNLMEHIQSLQTLPQPFLFLIALIFINFPPYSDKISLSGETQDIILYGQRCFDLINVNYIVL